eukprot:1354204-Amorphochlora_amoeboformis.AAC.1
MAFFGPLDANLFIALLTGLLDAFPTCLLGISNRVLDCELRAFRSEELDTVEISAPRQELI